jgi:hypothetical protein
MLYYSIEQRMEIRKLLNVRTIGKTKIFILFGEAAQQKLPKCFKMQHRRFVSPSTSAI